MNLEKLARRRAGLISLGLGLIILVIKFMAYQWSGSAALKSDAFESTVNVLSALFALGAVIFADQPVDADHPYGHGKIENFSAVFEGGLISLAAIIILYEGIHALVTGPELKHLSVGLALNLIAGSMNGILGWFLVRSGRELKSHAIEADGHHVLSDFYTSIAVALGVAIVWLTGITWLDGVIAVLMGIWLVTVGFKLVKKASGALLDSEDPEVLKKIVSSFNELHSTPLGQQIITLHGLRTIRAGRTTHVDVHVVVPENIEVRQAHDLVEKFGKEILKVSGLEGEFHSHIDPCMRYYCKNCSLEPCSIRKLPLQQAVALDVAAAVTPDPDEHS